MRAQENGSDPSFKELAADLQLQAAVKLVLIVLLNQFETIAEVFVHRMIFNGVRVSWIKSSLILFVTGLACLQSPGATNKPSNFETPPPVPGSIQWENIQRTAKQRQELYRKRLSIPEAVETDVPRANGVNFANNQKMAAAQTQTSPSSAALMGSLRTIFLLAAILIFTGILILKRFAPDVLNQWLNPWELTPATERALSSKVRAEEEAFTEFLTTFRIGPAVPARTDPLEKHDRIKEFYARAAKFIRAQRKLLQELGREPNRSARQKILMKLYSEVSSLKNEAVFPEVLPVWQVASALEGLLKQLADKMGNVTPSTLRTVSGGVDLLNDWCVTGLKPDLMADHPLKFLVVDDDLISRQAMALALKKTFGQADLAVDGTTALAQADQQTYDVIFLDVQLPGMDGFELCEKIRNRALNRNTPVIFVTSQSDFDARAKSTLSGGNDLMGKPFLTFEITAKALTLAWQSRLNIQKPLLKLDQASDQAMPVATGMDSAHLIPGSAIIPRFQSPMSATTETNNFIVAFLARASTHIGPLRDICRTIIQAPDEETRQNMLADAFLRVNSLIATDGSEVVHPAYQTCVALEGLLKKVLQDPKYSTPSALATIVAAVDLLPDLCAPGLRGDLAINPPVHLLVVDDDLVARRVIVGALQTAFTKPESAENGEMAVALARKEPFDVIFLDVIMPGMDGFEVCAKIRETVPNRAAPVIFVTGHSDFQTRTQTGRNGGNDLMGKPFLTSEITVKALTYILRGRLEQSKVQPTFLNTSLILRTASLEGNAG